MKQWADEVGFKKDGSQLVILAQCGVEETEIRLDRDAAIAAAYQIIDLFKPEFTVGNKVI